MYGLQIPTHFSANRQPIYNSTAMPISHQGDGPHQAVIQLGAFDAVITDMNLVAPTLHHYCHQLEAALHGTPAGCRVQAHAVFWSR